MKNRWIMLLAAAGIAVIFISTGIQAGTEVKDSFEMQTDGYTKRKKAPPKYKPVTLNHKKHFEDYKLGCGECHHDDSGQPLNDLKIGDDVKGCGECHNIFEKNKDNKDDIMVHENAIHENCVNCHKQVNIDAGDPKGRKGPAPTSCSKCHERA